MVVKKYFFFVLVLIALAFPFNLSIGQSFLEEEEPPENYQFQVFMEEEEALAKVFADCDSIESEFLVLTPKGRDYIQGLLKRRDMEMTFQVYFGKKGNVIDRYAIITEEMGCFHPITWILSTNAQGKILDVAVMIYRETRGREVSRKRFLKQFEGKSYNHSFSTNKDIVRITGATVSVQAVCRGVKKMLTIINEFYMKKNPASTALVQRLTPEEANAMQGPYKQMYTTARIIEGVKAVVAAEVESEKRFFSLAHKAFQEIERIENLFKRELKALNSKAGKTAFSCDREVLGVIKRCYEYAQLTEGAFDITVSPLLERWGIYKGTLKEVREDKLLPLLQAVSYKNIRIDDNNRFISFAHKQTKIDLGPVIRGYAVDRVLELFKESGVSKVCINYGSITRMREPPSEKNSWKVGILHPVKENSVIGSLQLVDRGVAFVADYSRYTTVQDRFSLHLIDPKIGKPVKNGNLAVTAVADTAEEAGVLATILFINGVEDIQGFPSIFPEKEWLLLSENQKGDIEFQMSSGMEKRFTKGEERIFKFGNGSGCPFSP